jgi:hypothetical protein
MSFASSSAEQAFRAWHAEQTFKRDLFAAGMCAIMFLSAGIGRYSTQSVQPWFLPTALPVPLCLAAVMYLRPAWYLRHRNTIAACLVAFLTAYICWVTAVPASRVVGVNKIASSYIEFSRVMATEAAIVFPCFWTPLLVDFLPLQLVTLIAIIAHVPIICQLLPMDQKTCYNWAAVYIAGVGFVAPLLYIRGSEGSYRRMFTARQRQLHQQYAAAR